MSNIIKSNVKFSDVRTLNKIIKTGKFVFVKIGNETKTADSEKELRELMKFADFFSVTEYPNFIEVIAE